MFDNFEYFGNFDDDLNDDDPNDGDDDNNLQLLLKIFVKVARGVFFAVFLLYWQPHQSPA